MLHVLLAVVCTALLISFAVYSYLVTHGSSQVIIEGDANYLPLGKRAFLLMAFLAFLICIYQGIDALLFWIPDIGGYLDEDGDYQSLKVMFIGLFAFLIGIPLFSLLEEGAKAKEKVKVVQGEVTELRRILMISNSLSELQNLEKEYQANAETEFANQDSENSMKHVFAPEKLYRWQYRELASIVKSLIDKSFHK
jgi:hypothetical protein